MKQTVIEGIVAEAGIHEEGIQVYPPDRIEREYGSISGVGSGLLHDTLLGLLGHRVRIVIEDLDE